LIFLRGRADRGLSPSDLSLGNHEGIPPLTVSNLGAAGRDAKGTAGDYLTHPNAIPVEKMAFQQCFRAVVKTAAGIMTASTPFMFSSAGAEAQA
jgi:hypothetical protein